MKLLNIFKNFKNDEAGAVTVDFVVLTGAVVALAAVVATSLNTGLTSAGTAVNTKMSTAITPGS
jgi:Flp pilus assembly pilin Flp